jgi:hypothetical protein
MDTDARRCGGPLGKPSIFASFPLPFSAFSASLRLNCSLNAALRGNVFLERPTACVSVAATLPKSHSVWLLCLGLLKSVILCTAVALSENMIEIAEKGGHRGAAPTCCRSSQDLFSRGFVLFLGARDVRCEGVRPFRFPNRYRWRLRALLRR